MGDKTGIEWTDASWNPVVGCSKVSQGCKNCYAERVFPRAYPGEKFTNVRFLKDRLMQPLRWQRPRRIFVNSMSDLFHERLKREVIAQIFAVMALAPHHTFQFLTKRAFRMYQILTKSYGQEAEPGEWNYCFRRDVKYWVDKWDWCSPTNPKEQNQRRWIQHQLSEGKWPLDHVHFGVSVENQETADERIPYLLKTPARVRWVSYEPALGPVDFTTLPSASGIGRYLDAFSNAGVDPGALIPNKLDWVVVGGESGPQARPSHPDWFRAVRDQCQTAGVKFFFKQWGEWTPERPESYTKISSRRFSHQTFAWDVKGNPYNPLDPPVDHFPSVMVYRVGKKRAGNLLDGAVWKEYPTP